MRWHALLLTMLIAGPSVATEGQLDVAEPGSREAIAAATTEPRFLSPWVASVPEHANIPSPTDFLGHIAGAPGELTRTKRIYAYYRALAEKSDRVAVQVIGHSEEDREILLVIVGDEAALRDLAAARADMAALADPRRTDATAMEQIVARTRPFYMLHGGLHSTETGSPEMLMELTYRLAVSEAPHIRQVRDNMTILINPVAEPDGRDRAVDWFYRHLKGKTDYDEIPSYSVPYWGKYVLHDNNRDAIQRKLALTRATQDTFLAWHPIVMHDLHESIALLSIWTGTGPYNTNLDPITAAEWHSIAFHEVTRLTAFGMPGVWTWGFGEGWAHVFAESVAINHNAIGRGYETFGNETAETVERVLDPNRRRYAGTPVTDSTWYRPMPPPERFKWSLRNNTNYMQTGVLSALEYTALNGKQMMRNFWQRGRNAIDKGENEAPYAIAIPEDTPDRQRLAALVNLLRAHGIEVSRTTESFQSGDQKFAKGTFLVKLAQPYRSYALDLLIAQEYPAATAEYDAYDDVGWALPVSYGVEVTPIDDAKIKSVRTRLVEEPVIYRGDLSGRGSNYVLRDSGQEALLAARVRLAAFEIDVAEQPFRAGGSDYPAGSWLIVEQTGLEDALERVAYELALDFEAVRSLPKVPKHALDWPRFALLQAWADTESAGWVRMIFDDEGIPYTLIMDEDVRRGNLNDRFDVILYPNTYDSLKGIIGGIDPRFSPLAFTQTPEFESHGSPTASDDITGGFSWAGIHNIETFVRGGGLLVTLGGASTLPLDGGIARNIRHAWTENGIYNPGSELRARFRRPDHPIAYGYPETTSVFREAYPLYEVRRADRGHVILQWGSELPDETNADEAPLDRSDAPEDSLVVSGGVRGAEEISGKPALLDIPVGGGRVIAFNFDPIHRYQTLSDFRLVWNVLLNWNDMPPAPRAH